MTKVEIIYRCGCSFSTKDQGEATRHCESTGHQISIHGSITTDKPKVKATSSPEKPGSRGRKVVQTPKDTQSSGEFDALRAKLKQGS
jgi:hypothetical protein